MQKADFLTTRLILQNLFLQVYRGEVITFEKLFTFLIFIAPAYSKVRYRGSTFRPFVRPFVRSFVRSSVQSVHNLCQGAYSVAVIAGSMKPCIVITLDTHFKKAP